MSKRPAKRKQYTRPRIKRPGAPRAYGGALGQSVRKAGGHFLGHGKRTTAYGQTIIVYDRAITLRSLISVARARIDSTPWFYDHVDKATLYVSKRTKPPELPIFHLGALYVDRGRLGQVWGKSEWYGADIDKAIAQLWAQTIRYMSISEDACTTKSGVLGWFARTRTAPVGPIKPRKRKQRRAAPRAKDKKACKGKPAPRVGCRGKARIRGGAGKHKMARGRTTRRKR